MPEIASITISLDDYINGSKNLTQEQIENIMFPEVLSNFKRALRSCNDKLSHLHPKSMLRLEKLGLLLEIILSLKDDVPLCVSCTFGTARRRQ